MRSSDIKKVLEDKDSRSPLPLIKKEIGGITYEHSLAERFYGDVFIGTAERNYYIDQYHELCLCAFYNRRIPGKYEFIPEYQFFITKQRMCLDIYWNLGNISDESMIMEKYDGLEAAKSSYYYDDFLDLKKKIDDSIKWRKEHALDPYKLGGWSSFNYKPNQEKRLTYTVYECPIKENHEIIQLYLVGEKVKMLSTSQVLLSDMMSFFKDFETLDKEELHLRSFLPIKEYVLPEGSKYHDLYTEIIKNIQHWKNVKWD